MKDKLLLTPEEAAQVLRCSRTTVYRLLRAGRLPTVHVGGRTLIPTKALETWLDGQTQPSGGQQDQEVEPCE